MTAAVETVPVWRRAKDPRQQRQVDILLSVILVLLVVNAVMWFTAVAIGAFDAPARPSGPATTETVYVTPPTDPAHQRV